MIHAVVPRPTPKDKLEAKKKEEEALKNKAKEEEKFKALKEKYPDCHSKITIDGKTIYLRKPNRYILSPVMAQINLDPVKALEELALALVIEEISDMEVIEDDELFIGIMPALSGMVAVKKSTLTIV